MEEKKTVAAAEPTKHREGDSGPADRNHGEVDKNVEPANDYPAEAASRLESEFDRDTARPSGRNSGNNSGRDPQHDAARDSDHFSRWQRFVKGPFPTFADLLAFLGIFLVAQLVGAFAGLATAGDPNLLRQAADAAGGDIASQVASGRFNAVTYFIAMSLTLAGLLFYRRQRRGPRIVARFSRRGLNPMVLLWGVVFMLAVTVVLEPLLNLLPEVPNVYGRGAWALLTIVVLAPLFEEVIFRGILLESMRLKWGPVWGWLLSSLLFGLVHVHPAVAVNAFFIGLVFAFVYLITRSLWSTIVLHAINNGIAYLVLAAGYGNVLLIDLIRNRSLYLTVYLVAVLVCALSCYMVFRTLRRLDAEAKNGPEA